MTRLLQTLSIVIYILIMSCTSTTSGSNILPIPEIPETQPEKIQQVVIGYLPLDDWEFKAQFSSIEWKYLTHINMSFARVKADGTLNIESIRDRIQEVRETARKHNVKVLISLAKNGKGEFTAAINDPKARKELVKQIIAFTKEYELDGFDIDYEEYDKWDVYFPSLLVFAKSLYDAKDKEMLMTCAVNSRWLKFGTEWQQYFDYINLMSYDRRAFTETPIQHASYDDFVKDLEYWNTVCMAPKDKIVGGLPFYGYSWDESLKDIVDDVRGIRYHTILEHLGTKAAELDVIDKTYYNGRPTIRKKCKFVKENGYAGVMIWQLFQDAHNNNQDLKLIKAVGETIILSH
ncbi:glycosyl hydrolase family 18 protein [Bacteroides faecichinchillae]|uniref:glycosyl hydrolase family 18 protein n=1 Tax=Bacteroides faecichinchillae TaxID=871325 RepID=UPI003518E56A